MVNLMLRHGRAPGFEEDEGVVCADPDSYDARKDVHEGEEFDSEDKGVDEVGTTQRVSDRHHATESQVWSRDMAPNIWNIVRKYILVLRDLLSNVACKFLLLFLHLQPT